MVHDEAIRETVAAYIANERNQRATAIALGCSRRKVQKHLEWGAARGFLGPMETMPGFVIKTISSKAEDGSFVKQVREPGEEFKTPAGHLVKGESALVDSEGRVLQKWVKTKLGELDPIYLAERMAKCFEGLKAAEPRPAPLVVDAHRLALYPLPDLHLGLYAWGAEAAMNWDLATAVEAYRDAMAEVVDGTPPAELAIVLGGGDYIHANTNEFRTQSGNVLDGDGRTDKVIDAGLDLAVYKIDLALQKHARVLVRFLKGNHDEYASIAIVQALAAWYRNEPRVSVDKDPSLFWWHRFGKVLLGASHGHNVKIGDMPLIMANRVPTDWGETEHRFVHMFHVHHKTQHIFENGGVIAESHQSPAAQDSWHFGKGYLSGRSMQSITYHQERGEIVRNRVAL